MTEPARQIILRYPWVSTNLWIVRTLINYLNGVCGTVFQLVEFARAHFAEFAPKMTRLFYFLNVRFRIYLLKISNLYCANTRISEFKTSSQAFCVL